MYMKYQIIYYFRSIHITFTKSVYMVLVRDVVCMHCMGEGKRDCLTSSHLREIVHVRRQ